MFTITNGSVRTTSRNNKLYSNNNFTIKKLLALEGANFRGNTLRFVISYFKPKKTLQTYVFSDKQKKRMNCDFTLP